MWEYDAPTGTWRDEDLSVRLLAGAERIAERRAVLMDRPPTPIVRIDEDGTGGYRAHRDERFPEYGWAFPADTSEDRMIEQLATILRQVTHWVVLPHLRRTGTMERPGGTMAFYGVGFTPALAGLPVLEENAPIPDFS